jgi:hypothetical protein
LITLNVPDTWCEKAGDGAWFGISVNNEVKVRGVYYVGKNGQRVPMSLQAVVNVNSYEHLTIKAVWCNEKGTADRSCCIGEYSEATLSVLVID